MIILLNGPFGIGKTTTAKILNEKIENSIIYDPVVRLSYDSKQLPAPSNYKEILSGYYGDYMSFPPLEKRQPEHFFDCKIHYD